jgi:hypothetical protein
MKKYMSWYSNNNEKEEKVFPVVILREYKRKSGIEDRRYSDKIKATFNSMNNKNINKRIREIDGLLSRIIQEKFKNVHLNSQKSEFSSFIGAKFTNFNVINSDAKRERGSLGKIIMNKFKLFR